MFEPGTYRIAADLLRVRSRSDKVFRTLSWGDRLKVTGADAAGLNVDVDGPARVKAPPASALVKEADARSPQVLKVDFVDVQQGDATVLETADGATMLVDGGENLLFARYLAGRFRGTTSAAPKPIDCIVVSHGDADHFAGLTRIFGTESEARKQLFLAPERIFHNGIVRRAAEPKLGATVKVGRRRVLTELHDDVRTLPTADLSDGFAEWQAAVNAWSARRPTFQMRRVQRGDHAQFDFLRSRGVDVQVLGPVTMDANGGPGLPWLTDEGKTINGHSVVLLVRFGNVRFLLAGDLNTAAEKTLVADHEAGTIDLRADVLKVPHHGSADYLPEFLERVAPGVSVVSSGDEREHIHPRATLLAALGRHARPSLAEPVMFITELAAFFKSVGQADTDGDRPIWAFERSAFGIVRCRTDGQRLLVYTDTGVKTKNEAYAFTVAADGTMAEDKVSVVP
ncbi:MBL fold metallo-hydrolase [Solirubrobacter sp. CPCC 204708]|uniref:MBL fold metallo-hydrolase n=1 Tax=Solirubrobacter deserti TaxID=2282478 RepID=A0ABT4RSE4_9ACTN|nr:MBL fold metallo-hydrolase [Solirubrobacter deserti]MBE2319294.1 MBL fold metallo-hydrolase [Solirubrobacter deserti]MDA0141160.1 MBL fold metallo-hydrolase [Solirubrobacter deserti]